MLCAAAAVHMHAMLPLPSICTLHCRCRHKCAILAPPSYADYATAVICTLRCRGRRIHSMPPLPPYARYAAASRIHAILPPPSYVGPSHVQVRVRVHYEYEYRCTNGVTSMRTWFYKYPWYKYEYSTHIRYWNSESQISDTGGVRGSEALPGTGGSGGDEAFREQERGGSDSSFA
jgi:hypothetical protein